MSSPMKEAYAEFCSRHLEAVSIYKDLLKTDRKFQSLISVSSDVHCVLLVCFTNSVLQESRLTVSLNQL